MICGAYVSTAPDAKPTFHKTISQNTQAQNRLTCRLTTSEEIMAGNNLIVTGQEEFGK
jgi:hypothetical protein